MIKKVVKNIVSDVSDDPLTATLIGSGVALVLTGGISFFDELAEHGFNSVSESILEEAEVLRQGE